MNLFNLIKGRRANWLNRDVTNEGTIFAPSNTANYSQMNTFLQNNFPNITFDQLSRVDSLYPKAQQFPHSGAYWRTAANAYGEASFAFH